MSADVIDLASRRMPNPGNGAVEALDKALREEELPVEHRDRLLARLWLDGFRIVPLEEGK